MPPIDSDRPDGDGHPEPLGDPTDLSAPPIGTVAEEAAKLVEMLATAGGPWMSAASAARAASPGFPPGSERRGSNGSDGADDPGSGSSSGRTGPSGSGTHTCTCGGTTPQACRLCPVCQVISFVSAISPETIDRAADLVGFAATALRDLATAQRERQEATARTTPTGEDVP